MYIDNIIFCIILHLHQITKKLIKTKAEGVSNTASIGVMKNLISFSLLIAVISLSLFSFLFFLKVMKKNCVVFLLLFENIFCGKKKIYLW